MADKLELIRITADNATDFSGILPDLVKEDGRLNLSKIESGIGITRGGKPAGAVIVQKSSEVLTIRSIRFASSSGADNIPS